MNNFDILPSIHALSFAIKNKNIEKIIIKIAGNLGYYSWDGDKLLFHLSNLFTVKSLIEGETYKNVLLLIENEEKRIMSS